MKSQTPVVDLYFSFRSPYSYLALPRLVEMVSEWELNIRLQVVLPLAIRSEDFFDRAHPLWVPYLFQDVPRLAEQLGLPYDWPNPDPVLVDPQTGRPPANQPHIYRLSRLGVLAEEAGRGLDFAREVSAIIWGGVAGWDQGNHLAQAADRAGLDLKALDERAVAEEKRLDEIIEANQKTQLEVGHWGVPTMAFEGEPFFGQDRIGLLLWRLQSKGLRARV